MHELDAAEYARVMGQFLDGLLADNLRRFEEGMESIARLSETGASEDRAQERGSCPQAA